MLTKECEMTNDTKYHDVNSKAWKLRINPEKYPSQNCSRCTYIRYVVSLLKVLF